MQDGHAIEHQAPQTARVRAVTLPSAMTVAVSLGLTLLVVATWVLGGFDGIWKAYAHMRGETLIVDSATKSFGSVAPGEPISVTFRLMNRGDAAVRVVGCEAGCGCIVLESLPFVLDPNENRDLAISVRNPNRGLDNAGKLLDLNLSLWTTNPAQPRVPLNIKGEIRRISSQRGTGG